MIETEMDFPYIVGEFASQRSIRKTLHTGNVRGINPTRFLNSDKVSLTKLQRNITQKLEKTWRAIEIIQVGQSDWISLTDEGKYLRYVMKNEETY